MRGQYEIGRELGQGGMATVFRAHHLVLKESVALKVLRPEVAAEEELAKRFKEHRLDTPASEFVNSALIATLLT